MPLISFKRYSTGHSSRKTVQFGGGGRPLALPLGEMGPCARHRQFRLLAVKR